MKIRVRERLLPFSHLPGVSAVIPGTRSFVKVFPTRLILNETVFDFPLRGATEGFTVVKDLERGEIRVFGKWFEYILKKKERGITLNFTRSPWGREERLLIADASSLELPREKLFLGCLKAQDVEKIRQRRNLSEILPFIFHLGKWTPAILENKVGTTRLLNQLHELIQKREALKAEKMLLTLFRVGFHGLFCPRLKDEDYQGLIEEEDIVEAASPFPLLHEGSHLIRSLFIQEEGSLLYPLPCLPPSLHAGRLITDEIDLEWSKKVLRRMILRPTTDRQIQLKLQSELKRFRLRTNLKEKGKVIAKEVPLGLRSGEIYFFDRFEK